MTGVPLPSHATSFDIVIDNGLERVNAGSRQLRHDVPLDLEFELVRHSKLEFKLNFYVPLNDPRNYHLKPSSPSMASMWSAPDSPRKGGLRGLFSSPKRSSKHLNRDDGASRIEPLVTTLDRDNKLADVLIAFDEHEDDCLGRLRTFNFPILPTFGAQSGMMRRSPSGSVGHIVMQMLYVPPLPNMPREELPSKSEDWMMGLEIAEWWQTKFHEGFLNQMGADCPVRTSVLLFLHHMLMWSADMAPSAVQGDWRLPLGFQRRPQPTNRRNPTDRGRLARGMRDRVRGTRNDDRRRRVLAAVHLPDHIP